VREAGVGEGGAGGWQLVGRRAAGLGLVLQEGKGNRARANAHTHAPPTPPPPAPPPPPPPAPGGGARGARGPVPALGSALLQRVSSAGISHRRCSRPSRTQR
jgi:hypothetical protein